MLQAFIGSLLALLFGVTANVVGPVLVPAYLASGLPGDSIPRTVLA